MCAAPVDGRRARGLPQEVVAEMPTLQWIEVTALDCRRSSLALRAIHEVGPSSHFGAPPVASRCGMHLMRPCLSDWRNFELGEAELRSQPTRRRSGCGRQRRVRAAPIDLAIDDVEAVERRKREGGPGRCGRSENMWSAPEVQRIDLRIGRQEGRLVLHCETQSRALPHHQLLPGLIVGLQRVDRRRMS